MEDPDMSDSEMQNAEESLCSLLVASYSVYDDDIIIHPGQYICRYICQSETW